MEGKVQVKPFLLRKYMIVIALPHSFIVFWELKLIFFFMKLNWNLNVTMSFLN